MAQEINNDGRLDPNDEQELVEALVRIRTRGTLHRLILTPEEMRNNMVRCYGSGEFPILVYQDIERTDAVSGRVNQIDVETAETIRRNIEDLEIIPDVREKIETTNMTLNGIRGFIDKNLHPMIHCIGKVLERGGTIQKRTDNNITWICWKITENRILKLGFSVKSFKIYKQSYHVLLSVQVLGHGIAQRDNTWQEIHDNNLRLVLDPKQLAEVLIASKVRMKLPTWEIVPYLYWYYPVDEALRKGLKPLEENGEKFPIVRSKKAPYDYAKPIYWDSRETTATNLMKLYTQQEEEARAAAAVADDEDELPVTEPNDQPSGVEEFVEHVLKRCKLKKMAPNFIFPCNGFKIGCEFWNFSWDAGAFHILIRHWDQLKPLLLYATNKQKDAMDVIYSIYQDYEEKKSKFDKNQVIEQAVSLMEQVTQCIARVFQSPKKNVTRSHYKCSYGNTLLIALAIKHNKYELYIEIVLPQTPTKENGTPEYRKIISCYPLERGQFELYFDNLKYWYELDTGKIWILNNRDVKISMGLDSRKEQEWKMGDTIINDQPFLIVRNGDNTENNGELRSSMTLALSVQPANQAEREIRELPTNAAIICQFYARELVRDLDNYPDDKFKLNAMGAKARALIRKQIEDVERGHAEDFESKIKAMFIEIKGLTFNEKNTANSMRNVASDKIGQILATPVFGSIPGDEESVQYHRIADTDLMMGERKTGSQTVITVETKQFCELHPNVTLNPPMEFGQLHI